jgi:hypothetical protein
MLSAGVAGRVNGSAGSWIFWPKMVAVPPSMARDLVFWSMVSEG